RGTRSSALDLVFCPEAAVLPGFVFAVKTFGDDAFETLFTDGRDYAFGRAVERWRKLNRRAGGPGKNQLQQLPALSQRNTGQIAATVGEQIEDVINQNLVLGRAL